MQVAYHIHRYPSRPYGRPLRIVTNADSRWVLPYEGSHAASVRRPMFIDASRKENRPPKEGHVSKVGCVARESMSLLTEAVRIQ
jgi:hypothetical protein